MKERILQPCAACASHAASPQLAPPRRSHGEQRGGRREAGSPFAAPAEIAHGIAQARGGGRPLDAPVRSHMESSLGTPFESVRVHTDARANHLAKSLNARAFTVGSDVFFRHGEYAPTQSAGRTTLAHELAHVGQQARNEVPAMPQALCAECGGGGGITVRPPGDHFERAADEAAQLASRAVEGGADELATVQRLPAGAGKRVLQRFCDEVSDPLAVEEDDGLDGGDLLMAGAGQLAALDDDADQPGAAAVNRKRKLRVDLAAPPDLAAVLPSDRKKRKKPPAAAAGPGPVPIDEDPP